MTTGSGSLRGFRFDDETLLPCSDQLGNFANGHFIFSEPSPNSSFTGDHHQLLVHHQEPGGFSAPSSVLSAEADSLPFDDNDFSETVFSYISQMLMEEDMEEKPSEFHDPSALEATEKSLFEALAEKCPFSPSNFTRPPYSLDDSFNDNDSGNSTDYGGKTSSPSSFNSVEPQWIGDFGENYLSLLQSPISENFILQSTANSGLQPADLLVSAPQVSNFYTQSDLALQFQRGVEEASKFLPKGNQFFIDLESSSFNLAPKEKPSTVLVKMEKEEEQYSLPNGNKEKKNHEREETEFDEQRSNKQSAVYEEEAAELSEMFDKILIFPHGHRGGRPHCHERREFLNNEVKEKQKPDGQNNVSNGGGKAVTKKLSSSSSKPSNNSSNNTTTKKAVDLRTLLVLCAQAVSTDDRRTAREYLKQIRQHSSPFGDGSQRLAHCFANGLEARLEGNGTQIYNALSSKRTSAVDMLKAYQVYVSSCPFQKMANIFANHTILDLARKAISTLHIIDFGILYGFQWPALIFRLSKLPGGPRKLRITGIELPQPGFRPAERVHETGRHLAKCCERFNVPFEYNAIAQKWETIRMEDLKLRNDELIVVNSMFRFKNLLDETVALNNPRDSVLKLIRRINPSLFLQAIVNGSYSVPFFVTRFREALFHYSSLFDAFDANLAREDQMRLMFEKQWLGRETVNVIACEGAERVERPESYKQWQVRNMRAGFRQVPLDPFVMGKIRHKLKESYHEDFVLDEDGCWMLQGWKGRILYASSCWVPA
ncbi:hypothetical protein CDL15_Pgr024982 [Punica granatum]|uniref:Uncharacterized protein n=1 Tax=Punica granatum TaxID=22663 RepID=A0A218W7M9_PUNGR|nr:hypothetical protein CDL15_Pgr024982 [Punica granatum]